MLQVIFVTSFTILQEYNCYNEQKWFMLSFTMLWFFLESVYFPVAMLGTSCLVELCGLYMRVVYFEYIVSDLNYTNSILLIEEEISNPLKICRPSTCKYQLTFTSYFL